MPAFIDLTGHKYGKLTVIKQAERKNGRIAWLCRCDCGNEIVVTSNSLRTGNTKSCGCLIRKQHKKKSIPQLEHPDEIPLGHAKDLRGQKFNHLTPLYRVQPPPTNKSTQAFWKCQCDCGNLTVVCSQALTTGHTKGCGCQRGKTKTTFNESELALLQPDEIPLGKAKNLKGKRFGKLVVLYRTFNRIQPNGKASTHWLCQCDCGRKVSIRADNLTAGKAHSCGCAVNQTHLIGRCKPPIKPGTKFGKLTVIKQAPKSNSQTRKGIHYECQCDCGNIKIVPRILLDLGQVNSCGCLYSKGELKISNLLQQNNLPYQQEYTFVGCRGSSGNLRFDFYINNSYALEYDGEQHFKPSYGKNRFEIQQKYDTIKNEYCKSHNIPLIRIPYWHYDKITIDDLRPETSQFLIT